MLLNWYELQSLVIYKEVNLKLVLKHHYHTTYYSEMGNTRRLLNGFIHTWLFASENFGY